jgi:phosphatidylethanolamine-binding protein (PEBP) family uncharacterized protein
MASRVFRRPGWIITVLLSLAVALIGTGCGSSSNSKTGSTSRVATSSGSALGKTKTQTSRVGSSAPPITITVAIPIPRRGEEFIIPARYTCDGRNDSVPLEWAKLPAGTKQVAVFDTDVRPIDGKVYFNWAFLVPVTDKHVRAGQTPKSAIVARNSAGKLGYDFCPPKGKSPVHFEVRVEALGRPIAAQQGFNPLPVMFEAEKLTLASGLQGGSYVKK